MSILAVKNAVLTAAAGTSLATTQWTTLNAFRQRPKQAKLGTHAAVIAGRVKLLERRLTVPRGSGFKERVIEVELLLYATSSDEMAGGDDFDTFVENVMQTLRMMSVPFIITDPKTNAQSQLVIAGERIQSETLDPVTTAQQGRVRFYATVTCECNEIITA